MIERGRGDARSLNVTESANARSVDEVLILGTERVGNIVGGVGATGLDGAADDDECGEEGTRGTLVGRASNCVSESWATLGSSCMS